jgi:ComF family protein
MHQSFAPFLHQGPLARAIHRWKYEDHPELTDSLGRLLVARAAPFLKRAPRLIAPIPLHRDRYLSRRYDQAVLLAKELCRGTGATLVENALVRVRKTERQVGLRGEAREENVRDAFVGKTVARGQALLLVDDVLTTGATARAAAQAARDAGASEVWVLTLARAHSSL